MKIYVKAIIALVMFTACDTATNKIDRRAIKEAQAEREVKKVSEAEIMEATLITGRAISRVSQQALITTLQQAIAEGGVAFAVEFCNLEAIPLMDSLSKANDATIRRTTLKWRNPEDQPTEIEEELLEAYEYTFTQGEDPGDNVQKLNDTTLLYTKPIILGNNLCLQCHGKPEEDIANNVMEKIIELYPQDNAIGYNLNQMRGMWSIKLDKKEIIKAL